VSEYDVQRVRCRYPALREGLVLLDGPGGTQVAEPVTAAVAAVMRTAISNRHGPFRSSERADAIVDAARQAVADLVGGDPAGVILGPNMTTLTFRLADTLAATWRPGDEVVVTRLDHDANVRPWVLAATRAGATVRWADFDPVTCELPVEQYDALLSGRTRLVAVTGGSNAVGTKPDVAAVAARAHAAGALVAVDGVHLTPHAPVDVHALGADFFACSSYKFGGPHLGTLVADPGLLETLRPAKLVPSPDDVPDRFETGTPPFAAFAGLAATVDHLADLMPSAGSRRERVVAAMSAVADYEDALVRRLLDGLGALPAVRCLGAPARRTPTVAFTVDGQAPYDVGAALGARGIAVWSGDYYAYELMVRLGLRDTGGAVRVGAVHYTTIDEIDGFLGALAEVTARR
jgi:cysteine desulfurase family protein (TIGR01976 family)